LKAKPKSAASNKARAKKPQPKSSRRKLAAALTAAGAVAAAVLIYMLAVAPNLGLVKLKPEGGKYIDKKNGIAYVPADVNYEPFAVGQPYAEAGSITLHEIPGLDPKQWLTEKYEGVGAIYHSDEIELPGLDGWQAGAVLVCESDVITVQKAEITDPAEVGAIVAAATQNPLESEPFELVTERDSYKVYHLKFTSSVFEGLYYDIIYLDNGKNAYFYDRSSKLYYDAGELLSGYLPRTTATD
jgi:hypothetical protein